MVTDCERFWGSLLIFIIPYVFTYYYIGTIAVICMELNIGNNDFLIALIILVLDLMIIIVLYFYCWIISPKEDLIDLDMPNLPEEKIYKKIEYIIQEDYENAKLRLCRVCNK